MPGRNTHLVIAAICGGAAAYLVAREAGSSDAFPEILGGVAGAFVTAMVPDAIDPATSPSHRASGHSVAVAGLVSRAVPPCCRFATRCRKSAETFRDFAAQPDIQPGERANHQFSELASRFVAGFAIGLPVGFLSHIGADATTPRGLTLV
jgi:hypothetical protein